MMSSETFSADMFLLDYAESEKPINGGDGWENDAEVYNCNNKYN